MPRSAFSRRPPSDYTQRSVKLRLFACLAGIMFIAAAIELQAWKLLPIFNHPQPTPQPLENRTVDARLTRSHSQEAQPHLSEPVHRPPSSAAEILERYNIGESQLDRFVSGADLSPGEIDVVTKILYHFPKLGLENLHSWRQIGVFWDDLIAEPERRRANVFPLLGRVKRVEKQPLPADQAERFEFKHYFKVTMLLDGGQHQAVVYARRVPAAWPLSSEMDEPADADAIFLKAGLASADPSQLYFAAERLGWYPDRPHPEHHIGHSQLALGSLSMDVSLWDAVRASNGQGLVSADRECFYRLLDAVGFPSAPTILADAGAPLQMVPLLEKPADHFGNIVNVEGIARRVTKVPVSDPDVQSRFGIDHYYEIDLFVSLGDAKLRLGNDPSGEKNPAYRNTFPATLIVRTLPPGLPEGENIHELIRVPAVFFKIWAYRSTYTSRFGQLQPAPLFIATSPQVVSLQPVADWVTTALIFTAFALSLGVVGIIAWFYRHDGRSARKNRSFNPGNL